MTMRKMMILVVIAIAMASLVGCAKIPPGYVGIKVNQWGSDKGVQSYPAMTGMNTYNPMTESILEYPIFVQTAKWTHKIDEGNAKNEEICWTSKDKVSLCADLSLSYSLVPADVPKFYVKFRSDDLAGFTHGYLYNVARGALGDLGPRFTVEEAMVAMRQELVNEAKKQVNSDVNKYGVVLDQFDFIGQPRPPKNIADAINQTLEATQNAMRVENELRAIKAEAAKAVAKAEGEAAANKALVQSINPTLMAWRQLELQTRAVDKWNGELPTYNGGGALPFIQVK